MLARRKRKSESAYGGPFIHGTGMFSLFRTLIVGSHSQIRFSSVTYGRPISIHDNDCSVSMPGDVNESLDFKDYEGTIFSPVCLSTYQRELNKLYLIASPAIKQVYSADKTTAPAQAREYLSLVEEVTSRLWLWRQDLPQHLSLNTFEDRSPTFEFGQKAHCLQALSLHLTFDSLLIILHRPFLKQQMDVLQSHGLGGEQGLGVSGLRASQPQDITPRDLSPLPERDATLPSHKSQEQWWMAAARTAKLVQLPRLTELACDGHLVAFLAINLFNAAIVMIVLALSDPLTDAAQEAKRSVARIYRLQAVLGARSSLSKRSIVVLRDLVLLLSRRESEAMLQSVTSDANGILNTNGGGRGSHSTSIHDALSMPLGLSNAASSRPTIHSSEAAPSQMLSRFDDGLASVQRGK